MNDQILAEWLGRTETRKAIVTSWPVAALSATLDRDEPSPQEGDTLPPLWHWLFFLPTDRQSNLAPDGHVHRGGFLPPIGLPRRMWAGSRIDFLSPLRIGDSAVRESRIASITEKTGRSGPLVFVVVRHEIHTAEGLAIAEEHDIVYRGHGESSAPPPIETQPADWTRIIVPNDVLLFRYSALTFNGHRIHYDRRYCVEQEGYPGLVVHGPLIATLLLDLISTNAPEVDIARFGFRAMAPLFDTEPITLSAARGDGVIDLWASGQSHLALRSSAEIRR